MRKSKTNNLADKTDPSPGYLPWAPATKLPGSWHSNIPFFRELLDEIQNFDKFVNLQGLCDQVGELFKCSEGCECEAEGSDESSDDSEAESSDDRDRLERNSCPPGTMELEDREFIILDQWIPRMSEAGEKLIELRGKMEARASLSKKNLEERLAFLDEEASRRLVKQLPPEIRLPLMNNW
ncbi:hypothetical protein M407DRAFT_190231 [Tulasnella calospora MUT 4182]|uniref:Uncharacterized protein n=1 Tax=Tulasnella calospora MUT 4182 TaxID=1051891 RepID=A0A0C3L1D5_9AGAM|nr:hypothetical protein M407DRAFT_190231 [Tulasnella calospora MUT 4182]